jgi:hypothetical protein
MSAHGAIDTETQAYVLPQHATKGRTYVCADCSQRVIFRKGEVRTPHFAHFVPTTKCTYYNATAGESDSHKHAKLLLKKWILDHRAICFVWDCQQQGSFGSCGTGVERNLDHKDGDEVLLEYRSPSGGYVADLAVMNAGSLRYIIEIAHSHRTTTTCRPEPWFEVKASDIDEGSHYGDDIVYLDDCRITNPRFCSNCSVKCERWVRNIPILAKKYGAERMWRQDVPCIGCKTDKYSPEWIEKRPRQVCKMCLGNEPDKVRAALSDAVWS